MAALHLILSISLSKLIYAINLLHHYWVIRDSYSVNGNYRDYGTEAPILVEKNIIWVPARRDPFHRRYRCAHTPMVSARIYLVLGSVILIMSASENVETIGIFLEQCYDRSVI